MFWLCLLHNSNNNVDNSNNNNNKNNNNRSIESAPQSDKQDFGNKTKDIVTVQKTNRN